MDSIKTILFGVLAFNIVLVLFIVFMVRRLRAKQMSAKEIRQKQLIEQGKVISAQERLLKSKQDLLTQKDELLNEFRRRQVD